MILIEKEIKKGRIILAISCALVVSFAITAVALLVILFVTTEGLGAATRLAVLIPIGCIGLLIAVAAVYLSRE